MRTTKALREKLEKAAGQSGRSLIQEVEARLEQSLSGDFLLAELLGSGKNAYLLKLIAISLSGLDHAASPWYSNPASAGRLRTEIERAMNAVADANTWEEVVGALHAPSPEPKSRTVGMLEMPVEDRPRTSVKGPRSGTRNDVGGRELSQPLTLRVSFGPCNSPEKTCAPARSKGVSGQTLP
jgi:TraY domain